MGWLVIGILPLGIALGWPGGFPSSVGVDLHTEHFAIGDYLQLVKKTALIRLFLANVCLTLSPGWMSALYLFFFKDVLQDFRSPRPASPPPPPVCVCVCVGGSWAAYILAGFGGAPATAWISSKFGKHRTLMITTSAYSIGLCSILIMPKLSTCSPFSPVMIWCGGMASGFNLLISSMTADVGDEVRLEQGRQRMSLDLLADRSVWKDRRGRADLPCRSGCWREPATRPSDGAHNTVQAIGALEFGLYRRPDLFRHAHGRLLFHRLEP